MWKTSFNRVTIERVWKLQALLEIFIFDLKCLCRYQFWIHVDLWYSFKSAYDKAKFSWINYWDWIKGILKNKFLLELVYFCRYQLLICLYPPKVQSSIIIIYWLKTILQVNEHVYKTGICRRTLGQLKISIITSAVFKLQYQYQHVFYENIILLDTDWKLYLGSI